ncbi:MAG: hypothetical protein U9R43_15670 [Thermodesulfobacteriota bacterium]|nr:hypothetical protein [Thermodesulfobacteriota bacterium]
MFLCSSTTEVFSVVEVERNMTKITENAIETFTIELLEKQGYQYIYASVIDLIVKIAEGKLP